nr:diguanylate cyclase [Rhizobium sp. L1K21]
MPPVARDVIFSILPDPVIVLDENNVILELNPAAESHAELGAKPVGKTLPLNHPLYNLSVCTPNKHPHPELVYLNNNTLIFEVSQRSLEQWDRKGCRLLVLRDVTARETAKQRLLAVGEDLQHRLEENLILQKRLEEEATRDHLTGLHNRRHASTAATALVECATPDEPTSLILFDLDFFKQINDRFGHDIGDQVLVAFAGLLKSSLKTGEMAVRQGGEEFLIVLPQCSTADALERTAHIRSEFAKLVIPGLEDFALNFSAGIAQAPDAGMTLTNCIKAADIALYRAKISGRNQDVVWGNHLKGMGGAPAPAPALQPNRVA